jgi:hypothetical protein
MIKIEIMGGVLGIFFYCYHHLHDAWAHMASFKVVLSVVFLGVKWLSCGADRSLLSTPSLFTIKIVG